MLQAIIYFFVVLFGFATVWTDGVILKLIVLLPTLITQVYSLTQNKLVYRASFSVGSILLIAAILLGAMWNQYVSFAGIILYFGSFFLSIIVILLYMAFVRGNAKREREIVTEKAVEKKSFKDQLKSFKEKKTFWITSVKSVLKKKKEGTPLVLAIQLVYVEHLRKQQPPEINAMDFTFLKEVKYERNKYTTGSK
ncbi:hypothetical protein ACMGD3_23850 [Lysinibacillus sphaericus]|uniref:hypothetical protein n=1 Tax=Lysinibacillus sphaericus TaxID=1421 RepID=UPI003F78CE11